jgi:hypothetical protein
MTRRDDVVARAAFIETTRIVIERNAQAMVRIIKTSGAGDCRPGGLSFRPPGRRP